MTISPGWYPDPVNPETTRYWDGEQWVAPQTAPSPDEAEHASTTAIASSPSEESASTVSNSGGAGLAIASLSARSAARLIDFSVLLWLNIVVNGWFIVQYLDEVMPSLSRALREYQQDGQYATIHVSGRAGRLALIISIIAVALWLAYEVPAVINNGQTLGKRLVGLKITGARGEHPRAGQAFIRWCVFGIPLLFSLVIWAVFAIFDAGWSVPDRKNRRSLHDRVAHTLVLRINQSSPIERPHSHISSQS